MTKITILDLPNCVELTDDEVQAIHGGSWVSKWLRQNLGIPEVDFDPTHPKITPPPPPPPAS